MRLIRNISSFMGRPAAVRLLCLQAGLVSTLVWLAMTLLPFRWWGRWQGEVRTSTPEDPDPVTLSYRRDLSTALSMAARHLPVLKRCYIRALTGKILLARKGIPGTLYIGFRTFDDGRFEGHAWLRAHDTWITGAERRQEFSVHGIYS
ncbi:MAG: lasso peptide biosynthesis B2 protein [bacterium]